MSVKSQRRMRGGTYKQRKSFLPRYAGNEDRVTGASFFKIGRGRATRYVVQPFDRDYERTFKTKKRMRNYLNALGGKR